MPIPQYHLTTNGEYSSTSSMSTSSVSPANSSSSHSQSSPSQQHQHPTLNSKSSTYLLTTACSKSTEQPPSYTTLKRSSKTFNPDENHYNNSNQSLSDGKFHRLFSQVSHLSLCFFFKKKAQLNSI